MNFYYMTVLTAVFFDTCRYGCTTWYYLTKYMYHISLVIRLQFTLPNYCIHLAIRQDFSLSRMSSNNQISSMKFCYNMHFTLPKQSQRSRSVLYDGSRILGLFWKVKTLSYHQRNMVPKICKSVLCN